MCVWAYLVCCVCMFVRSQEISKLREEQEELLRVLECQSHRKNDNQDTESVQSLLEQRNMLEDQLENERQTQTQMEQEVHMCLVIKLSHITHCWCYRCLFPCILFTDHEYGEKTGGSEKRRGHGFPESHVSGPPDSEGHTHPGEQTGPGKQRIKHFTACRFTDHTIVGTLHVRFNWLFSWPK